jgi:hypothetical protein
MPGVTAGRVLRVSGSANTSDFVGLTLRVGSTAGYLKEYVDGTHHPGTGTRNYDAAVTNPL